MLLIGYAIRGRGFESIEGFKEAVEKIRKLKEEKSLAKKIELLEEVVDENKQDSQDKK